MRIEAMKRYIVCSVACMVFSGTIFASAPQRVADSDYDWIDVATLDVGGRAALSEQEPFVRMVKSQRDVAPKFIQGMARESTGLSLRFRTTSRKLVFRYVTERRNWKDPLIPPSGLQSVSVWRQTKGSGEWEYICKNHPNVDGDNEYVIGWNPDSTGWLYFPMRSVVKTFSIGVEHGAKFETVGYPRPEKVVIYGTSIVHGGCVSSGGMMFTSFAGRRLGCEIVNLGFSGGGKMELHMADLIARIDASIRAIRSAICSSIFPPPEKPRFIISHPSRRPAKDVNIIPPDETHPPCTIDVPYITIFSGRGYPTVSNFAPCSTPIENVFTTERIGKNSHPVLSGFQPITYSLSPSTFGWFLHMYSHSPLPFVCLQTDMDCSPDGGINGSAQLRRSVT